MLQKGEMYRCSNCGGVIRVIKGATAGKGGSLPPTCGCGMPMQKPLDLLGPSPEPWRAFSLPATGRAQTAAPEAEDRKRQVRRMALN